MTPTTKRILASVLTLCMLLVHVPFNGTAVDFIEMTDLFATEVPGLTRLDTNDYNAENDDTYLETDMVTVIVVMDDVAVLDYFSETHYFSRTLENEPGEAVSDFLVSEEAVQLASGLLNAQQDVIDDILSVEPISEAPEVISQWTAVVNGMAIRVPYAQLAQIRGMRGVRGAYVSKVFSAPENELEDAAGTAGYSYSMIGIEEAWNRGYTGAGMLVAVLDTGLDLLWDSWYDDEVGDNVTGVRCVHEAFTDNSFRSEAGRESLRWTSESIADFLAENQLFANTGADGQHITYDYNALYKNQKVPYAADYADGDVNVRPDGNNHGTHVAGTVAGYAESEDGAVIFSGIAPDAQILAMKVFDDSGSGAEEYAILNALEDAAVLGADVMNLSFGSTNGFAFDDTLIWEAYQRLNSNGILFMTAAGNDGPSSQYNNYGDLNLSSNPETSMMGAPASFGSNLAVGSVENLIATQPVLKWTDSDGAENTAIYVDPYELALKSTLGTDSYNVIPVPGYGTVEDYRAAGFKDDYYGYGDKGQIGIALVKRGGTNEEGEAMTFLDKINNAIRFSYSSSVYDPEQGQYIAVTENFVKAVIIYDEDPESDELIFMSIDGATMTAVFISGKDGNALAAAAQEAIDNGSYVTLYVPGEDEIIESPTANQVSSFSSWGPNPGLELKPEITAPGGSIWSSIFEENYIGGVGAYDDYKGSYGMISGTSMAAPHMTGVTTLVMQYAINELGLTVEEAAVLADNLMVSTAIPSVDGNGVPYSPRVQGAGLVNTGAAISTPAYISVEGHNVGKIELKDDPEKIGRYVLTFQITNLTDAAITYDVNVTVLVPGTEEIDGQLFMLNADVILQEFAAESITIPGNQTVTYSATVALTDEEKDMLDQSFANGTYVEGFVTLTNATHPQIGLPFLGFYGDWTQAPIFEENTWMTDTEEGEYFWELDSTWGVSILGYYDGYSFRNLGQNPFDPYSGTEQWEYHEENITIAPYGTFLAVNDIELYQHRDAKLVVVEVVDANTGEVYYRDLTTYQYKTYYNYNAGVPVPWSLMYFTDTYWDGTDLDGNVLPSGTECIYSITAYGDGDYPMGVDTATGQEYTDFEKVASGEILPTFNGHAMDMTGDVLSYPMLVDTVAPKLVNSTVSYYVEDGRVYVTGTFQDDGSIASIEIVPHVKRTANYNAEYYDYGMDDDNPFYTELMYDARLGEYTFTADVTEYAHTNQSWEGENDMYTFEWTGNIYIFCGDYGGNDRAYLLNVNTEEGLLLTNSSALLHVGESYDLNVVDNTGSGLPLSRTSSNPDVATIDEYGHIVALTPGQTTITVSNGDEEVICVVAVAERPMEVIDFQLSMDHFSGLKPDGSIVVNVVNLEPADVVITQNSWMVYEDDEDWYGLLNVSKDSETALSGRVSLNATNYGDEGRSNGSGHLEVTINGVTRSMTIEWDDLYPETDSDGLISDAYYGEQTVFVTQGETAELIALYRQNKNHSFIPVKLYTMDGYESFGNNNPEVASEGLILDGPEFTANGAEWRGKLVALPGYTLPETIKICTRYSYGYEAEMSQNSYYGGYTYNSTTGEIVVKESPYGADNVLVIRANGVETAGAPGGTHSGIIYEQPDSLYGPFDWTVTNGNGELASAETTDYYGEIIHFGVYTPAEPGVSYITATSKDGAYSINFAVVCVGVKAEALILEDHNLEMEEGQTEKLDVQLTPTPTLAKDSELIFTSFNKDVATIDQQGNITAVGEGYAYILITTATDTTVMTYCIVKVEGTGGHRYDAWQTILEPGCETAGQQARTCKECGERQVRELPAIGHDYVSVVTRPTLEAGGYTTHTCQNCGDSYVDSYTDPITYVVGDLDINGVVDTDDAIYLLYHTLFGEDYPVNQYVDFDCNGVVDTDDAIYLLYHTLFGDEDYPLN